MGNGIETNCCQSYYWQLQLLKNFCIFRQVESEQEAGTVAGEDGPETQARHGASLRQLPPGSGRGGGQTSGGRGGQLSGLS